MLLLKLNLKLVQKLIPKSNRLPELTNEPRRHKGREDFVFYLIRATDQVNHHALAGNIFTTILPNMESVITYNRKMVVPEGWSGLSNRGLAGAKLEERRLVRFDKESFFVYLVYHVKCASTYHRKNNLQYNVNIIIVSL